MVRVAFQGELGAFSEEAVRAYYGETAVPVPCRSFSDAGEAVASGEVDFGLLPIENSLAGSVGAVYDVLSSMDFTVIGEIIQPIRHCLLAVPGSSLDRIRRVISHPVALAQCTRFLTEHSEMEAVAVYDTAGAAKEVAQADDPTLAAVASRGAADRYGLAVIAADVQDRADNQTRFYAVSRSGAAQNLTVRSGRGGHKTVLFAETENRPGALVELLLPFATRGVNLSKLESRPAPTPWTYRFFLELEGSAGATPVIESVTDARQSAKWVRILGSFPV
ncbi:MAG: prephenate dehydratase [Longimicrobiales bacterium]